MSITTYTDFVQALEALVVTGVTRRLSAPPDALRTADLPTQWAQIASGDEAPITFQTMGGWPSLRVEVIIAYQPIAQGTAAESHTGALGIMDNLVTALRGFTASRGPVLWSVRVAAIAVAGVEYWAVLAEVTGRG